MWIIKYAFLHGSESEGPPETGDRLQSEKKMCEIYGVNVYTVRKCDQLKKKDICILFRKALSVSEPYQAMSHDRLFLSGASEMLQHFFAT